MARRKKNGTAEEVMELVALFPWWVGVALAIVSYLVLHHIASTPLPTIKSPRDVTDLATTSVYRALAYGGQFFVPFILAMGALASWVRRRERKTLIESVSSNQAADALEKMTWREFEILVGEGFRQRGYSVVETGGGGADGGIDLVLHKGGEKFLVQCKQWKAFKVSVTVVRELYGVMAAHGAAGGFVVTSGQFTNDAKAFAKGRNIHLFDGPLLLRLIREKSVQPKAATALPTKPQPVAHAVTPAAIKVVAQEALPACPRCGSSMVRRIAKRGPSAGSAFWGCSGYPVCKGTRV